MLTTSPPKARATMTWPKMYSNISVETDVVGGGDEVVDVGDPEQLKRNVANSFALILIMISYSNDDEVTNGFLLMFLTLNVKMSQQKLTIISCLS